MVKEGYPVGLVRFYKILYEEVDNPSSDALISWGQNNNSFVIWDPKEISDRKTLADLDGGIHRKLFPMLKLHGFKRVRRSGPQLEFGNRKFVRGRPDLLKQLQEKAMSDNRKRVMAKEGRTKELERINRLHI